MPSVFLFPRVIMAFSLKSTGKFMTSVYMARSFAKRANPGLNYQISAIQDAVEVIQSDPEGFEGLESDLFKAHKSYKQHELEKINEREKIKRHLIKGKYFRQSQLPNLLTYAEKKQIRYLHSLDSEEWTVDKLASSFPANAEIISKIIKSDWNAISSKKIRSHDDSVMKNWERFKNGEYKDFIPKELEEHLNKFANRNVNDMNNFEDVSSIVPKKQWQKPISNEFSSIISTLQKKSKDSIKPIALGKENVRRPAVGNVCLNKDTYVQGVIKNKKPITINELKNSYRVIKANEDFALSNEGKAPDQVSTLKDECINETGIVASKNNSVTNSAANDFCEKFAYNEVNITDVDKKLYGISHTKQRIHIPRKLWHKGATYRANNCYYDDDGELLYKIPGMSLQ